MAQIVKLRRSSVSGQKPTNTNLQLGELALNTTDGKVYMAKSGSIGPSVEELISTNTVNTGSIHITDNVTASFFTGSFIGDGSQLTNIPLSGVTNLVTISGSFDDRLDSLEAYSGSQLVPSSSMSFRTLQTDVYCKNVTGAQINKGTVVRIVGATGDNPLIGVANPSTELTSANVLGIATQNIPNDGFGLVITEGVLTGVNTNGMTAGALLYLGTSGTFTTTPPTAPNHGVRLGEVLRVQQNNGSIYVRVDNGIELNEAHDVIYTGITHGDLLVRSGSVWKNSKSLEGNYTVTGSLTVTQNLTVLGSSSLVYVTSSNLAVSASFISVNVFEPAERFGGLKVYDSGSSNATASLAWDSQHNHWVYQNVDGASYSGGMLLSGPRNSGSLGDEPGLMDGRIVKSVGGDHIDVSIISETGTTINIDGNLVADSITGSFDFFGLVNRPTLVSGSSQIEITGTTGYSTFSSSVKDSIDIVTGSITDLSSSIATTTNDLDGRLDSIEGVTGSYATTGSNQFNGDQSISGSLNVSSSVTVNDLYVNGDSYFGSLDPTDRVIFRSLISSSFMPDSDGDHYLGLPHLRWQIFGTTASFNHIKPISGQTLAIHNAIVTGSFTGSYVGDGSGLYNIPSSGVTGLELNKIVSGSVSASISPDNGLQINTNIVTDGSITSSYGVNTPIISNNGHNWEFLAAGQMRPAGTIMGSSYDSNQVNVQNLGPLLLKGMAYGAQVITSPDNGSTSYTWEFGTDGKLTAPGDVNINGILTAKELHIDYVTSSVLYQSGSTKFGDTSDDTHNFTGSVNISGSINVESITGSIDFTNITNTPTLVSGSSQISYTGITDVPSGIISGSSQVIDLGFVTTSSFEIFTSSYTTDSASFDSRIDLITGSVTSLNNFSSSVVLTSETASMSVLTSSYALTASYALNVIGGSTTVSDGAYTELNQTVASTTWTFTHNLGQKYPIFQVFDTSDNVIIPTQITAVTSDVATITFSSPQAGRVIASLGTGPGGMTQFFESSATWSLNHNMGSDYPIVTVYNNNRKIIFPQEINSIDSNNIEVYFSTPVSGYLNVAKGGHIISGSVSTSNLDLTDSNIVSSSIQISDYGYAITGSNTFIGDQGITGSLNIRKAKIDSSCTTVSTAVNQTIFDLHNFDGANFDYVIKNGSNMRGGLIMAVWDGVNVSYNETSTTDLGDTSDVTFTVTGTGLLQVSVDSGTWAIEVLYRALSCSSPTPTPTPTSTPTPPATPTPTPTVTVNPNAGTWDLYMKSQALVTDPNFSDFDLFWKEDNGDWIKHINNTSPQSTTYVLQFPDIEVNSGSTISFALYRNSQPGVPIEFGAVYNGAYTGYCGYDNPYVKTFDDTENQTVYINVAVVSDDLVTCGATNYMISTGSTAPDYCSGLFGSDVSVYGNSSDWLTVTRFFTNSNLTTPFNGGNKYYGNSNADYGTTLRIDSSGWVISNYAC